MIAVDRDELKKLVKEYSKQDHFVFDIETTYTPTADEREERSRIEATKSDQRTVDEQQWLEAIKGRALDTTRNEIIWIGISMLGQVDGVACGHPHGRLITPARRDKIPVWEAFGKDDPRCWLKNGSLSERKIIRSMPAVFAPPPKQMSVGEVLEIMQPLFFSDRRKINTNIKFDVLSTSKYYGEIIPGPFGCTEIAQHLLNENLLVGGYKLGNMIDRHFHHKYDKLGGKGVTNFSFEKAGWYAMQDAQFDRLLYKKLIRRIEANPVFSQLYYEVEMPALEAFIWTEFGGVPVDVEAMDAMRIVKDKEIAHIMEQIIVDCGAPPDFNPNANLQIIDLLYTKCGGRVTKRTAKTKQISTDADALQHLADDASRPEAAKAAKLLLSYAKENKILSTYLVGPRYQMDDDNRVHPSYSFHRAVTGRTTCSGVNVQNVPRESDMREMFMAPPGFICVTGDYDQIELRIIAEMSDDPKMIETFNSGVDIHLATSALVQGISIDHPRAKNNRTTHGKQPNFLVGYGGSHYLLAEITGIEVDLAESIIVNWYKAYQRVGPWKKRIIREAVKKSRWDGDDLIVQPYVSTMMGRRRRLPNLLLDPRGAATKEEWKKINSLRSGAERQAVNAIIQGSACEIAKLAMIDIHQWAIKERFPLHIAMFVHDEIVSFVPEKYAEEIVPIYRELMTGVRLPSTGEKPLHAVELLSSCKVSERWKKE